MAENTEDFPTALKEYTDSTAEYHSKIAKLFSLMKTSKFITIFTGAGISTAASIPDIRGEHGLQTKQTPLVVLGLKEQDMDCILPTFSHCAITELVKRGIVKFVATSNHDGLHQKSGLSDEFIADVFGNVFIEKCLKCKRIWKRSVIVPSLGRKCDDKDCNGRLQKTGTRMGEATPEEPLNRAWEIAKKSDLAIVLGSSLTVSPFCEIPFLAKKEVIINLQDTSYDAKAELKIHCYCDQALRDICNRYSIEIQDFTFVKKFALISEFSDEKCSFTVTGERINEPSGVVSLVEIEYEHSGVKFSKEMDVSMNGDFVIEIDKVVCGMPFLFTFHFRENFHVPPMKETISLQQGKFTKELEFNKCVAF